MRNKQIGERIALRRKQLDLTLDDIALEIGVARSTVQRYEKGNIKKVKLPVIEAIARVLHVNPSWLCCKSDDMTFSQDISDGQNIVPMPTPVSESGRVNIVKLAGRDGSYLEKRLSDAQLSALKAMVEQLPDVPDDL